MQQNKNATMSESEEITVGKWCTQKGSTSWSLCKKANTSRWEDLIRSFPELFCIKTGSSKGNSPFPCRPSTFLIRWRVRDFVVSETIRRDPCASLLKSCVLWESRWPSGWADDCQWIQPHTLKARGHTLYYIKTILSSTPNKNSPAWTLNKTILTNWNKLQF